MLSRRTILAWFGIGVVAAAIPKVPTEMVEAAPVAPPIRARAGWSVRLEPDGSSTLVNGEKRFLQEWLKSGDQLIADDLFPMKDFAQTVEDDIAAVEVRANPFREVDEFRAAHGLAPQYREAKLYKNSHFVYDAENSRNFTFPQGWCRGDQLIGAEGDLEERYIPLDSPYRFNHDGDRPNPAPDRKMFLETFGEKFNHTFGYSKQDYWDTLAAERGRPISVEEIAKADASGRQYWKPEPHVSIYMDGPERHWAA